MAGSNRDKDSDPLCLLDVYISNVLLKDNHNSLINQQFIQAVFLQIWFGVFLLLVIQNYSMQCFLVASVDPSPQHGPRLTSYVRGLLGLLISRSAVLGFVKMLPLDEL